MSNGTVRPVPGEVGHIAEITRLKKCLEENREGRLTLAAHHIVGMLEPFIGQECDMRSTENHRHLQRPDPVSHGVGARGGGSNGADPDEVKLGNVTPAHRGLFLDDHGDIPSAVTSEGAEQNRPKAGQRHPGKDVQVRCLRFNQKQFRLLMHGSTHKLVSGLF